MASRLSFCAAAIAVSLIAPDTALAQAPYPTRPIRLVVGFAAGGPSDIVARVVGAKLSDILGHQVYVENRAGASGNLATETVARAPADGYTLLLATFANAVNESMYVNLKHKFGDDLAPVAPLAETRNVLIVHPSLEVKSVADLIAMGKAQGDNLLYATAGKGTATHLAGELFNMMAGTKMTAVHYKGGGETIKDLLSGQVKVMFSTIPPVLGFVRGGQLRGIATTGESRDRNLPDLPTVAASGLPGYDMRLWFGLWAPAGVAPEIIDKLSAATAQALKADDMKVALDKQGFDPLIGTPAQFGGYVRDEIAKWRKVIPLVGTIGN